MVIISKPTKKRTCLKLTYPKISQNLPIMTIIGKINNKDISTYKKNMILKKEYNIQGITINNKIKRKK